MQRFVTHLTNVSLSDILRLFTKVQFLIMVFLEKSERWSSEIFTRYLYGHGNNSLKISLRFDHIQRSYNEMQFV